MLLTRAGRIVVLLPIGGLANGFSKALLHPLADKVMVRNKID
jgi:hypothetical protein